MLDQDGNLCLISLSILVTYSPDNVSILKGEGMCSSLLGVKGSNHLLHRPPNRGNEGFLFHFFSNIVDFT